MACHDLHAATVLALLCGLASVGGLFGATLLPQWRLQRLYSTNKNDRNVSVSDGLWTRCVRFEGRRDCAFTDAGWYKTLDQLDLRVLQFALPFAMVVACLATLLCSMGMCNTACSSKIPNVNLVKCLVNSAGCHLVSGTLYLLSAALTFTPSLWVIFHTAQLNRQYGAAWSVGTAAYLALGSAAGLLLTAVLLFLWYCACKALPSPFWQPLSSYPDSVQTYASGPYSRRSRLSTLEIDIPVVAHQGR
ncbi:claudin-12 [Heterodontus francisci]|uniref:claudin-12 n=1 Tax=Heterodontus francisci TaxID=7792 RepID=UPI00355B111C